MSNPMKAIALPIACTLLLAGCTNKLNLKPVAEAGQSIARPGYSVTPPQGRGWFVAEGVTKGILFFKDEPGYKPSEGADDDDPASGETSHDFKLGVFPLDGDQETAAATEAQFPAVAERYLLRYFTNRRQNQLARYTTSPVSFKAATCIRYDSVMVGRFHPNPYSPRQDTFQRFQFANKGLLCRHPHNAKQLIHGFYTKTSLRELREEASKAAEAESEAVLQSLTFTE